MKKNRLHSVLCSSSIALTLFGCGSTKMESSKDLVVVEQTDSVSGGNEDNRNEWAAVTVDVPVQGPKALVDSVMVFINKQLYDACESNAHYEGYSVAFSQEEMYTDNGERLLSHYIEKYKPLMEDSLWRVFGLTLKLEAQTEKYVSYGLEYYYCGATCSSEKYYYTFDKNDGHQIKEIISNDNLVRFFADYPEYATKDDYLWEFSPENNFVNECYGLLEDHFSLMILGWYNHFFSVDVPYSQIFSYLSPEAQALVEQNGEVESMLPAYLPERSENSEVWMGVDTINCALLGYVRAAGGPLVDTLMQYEPELEIYPKRVHSIDAVEGSTVFLFIYSRGHLLYSDEALTCVIGEDGLKPAMLFSINGQKDSVVSCMWYDQLVAASDGFPYYELDENRFGIHYDPFTKRLYLPSMENHEKGSGYENCLRYTGRYEVLQFNGKEFVSAGTDGAWWLNPDLRSYKRTVSNKKTADGIEQIDLMPDGTSRHAVWKGAKTLDDLRKKPDEVKISKEKDSNK